MSRSWSRIGWRWSEMRHTLCTHWPGRVMNLGFADVAALGKVLKAREPFRDPGDRLLLRRYERSRKEAVRAMTLATDGLQRAVR